MPMRLFCSNRSVRNNCMSHLRSSVVLGVHCVFCIFVSSAPCRACRSFVVAAGLLQEALFDYMGGNFIDSGIHCRGEWRWRPTVLVAWRTISLWELCCPFFQVSAREMPVEEVFRLLLITVVSTLLVRAGGRLFYDYPGTSCSTFRRLWMPVVVCSLCWCRCVVWKFAGLCAFQWYWLSPRRIDSKCGALHRRRFVGICMVVFSTPDRAL